MAVDVCGLIALRAALFGGWVVVVFVVCVLSVDLGLWRAWVCILPMLLVLVALGLARRLFCWFCRCGLW